MKIVRKISQIADRLGDSTADLSIISSRYKFQAPVEYLSLIDWSDADDPIRRLVIPQNDEMIDVRTLDASGEASILAAPGLQHKFPDTALLLTSNMCPAYCRYCFRKRLFQPENEEVPKYFNEAFQYLRDNPKINNVILSGGDPLAMNVTKLREILIALAGIKSVKIIRIGSKVPAFDPGRILDKIDISDLVKENIRNNQQIYLIAHFDHPREVTNKAVMAIKKFQSCGIVCLNQCPLIKGVNSEKGILGELFEIMSFIGCPQYYVFHCRPTDGNSHFMFSIADGFRIFEREMNRGSGLAKTARYCISSKVGKIQVLAIKDDQILLKYLQTNKLELEGQSFWKNIVDDCIDENEF